MRSVALALAALALTATPGHAQTRGISTNPRSTRVEQPEPDTRDGDRRPRGEYGRRDGERGGGRRSRPVVIIVSPYDDYGPGYYDASYGGYVVGRSGTTGVGSATTTRYTGSYAPAGPRVGEPAGTADTTYVRYEAAPAASAGNAPPATPAAVSLAVERVAGTMLRLRWTGRTVGVRDVTLVVADAARRVLAAQTVRSVPFTAVFDDATRVAFVGTTVVRADGTSTTTLVPVGRVRTVTPRAALPAIKRTRDQ